MSLKPLIYLASASPRRRQLLAQIGVAHEAMPVDIDESPLPGESPQTYVCRLALAKAETLWGYLEPARRRPVLGADTTVTLDGALLGKPVDRSDALAMLARLSGRTHQVCTAVALRHADGTASKLSISEVTFRSLTAEERERYWETGEPADKAGAYAVQGIAAAFITRIAGSYSGIMGLPLAETAELLAYIGWQAAGCGLRATAGTAEKATGYGLQATAGSADPDSDLQPEARSLKPAHGVRS